MLKNLAKIGFAFVLASMMSGCATTVKTPTTYNTTGSPQRTKEVLSGLGVPLQTGEYTTVVGDDLSKTEVERVPTEVNRLVLQWIEYFQGRGRDLMTRYLERSGRYVPLMQETFEKQGLPKSLVYVALIESGFVSRAHSSAGAVGFWQFMRGTGKDYDLSINALVDERRDPALATEAAGRYLKGLYSLFGDWYLAMAAYNVGENRIKTVVMKTGTRDFWEIARKRMLPKETINYVPKYLAARIIATNPEKFGFTNLHYDEPLKYDTIEATRPVNLKTFAKNMKMDWDELKILNPKYKKEFAPVDKNGKVVIHIPVGTTPQAVAAVSDAYIENTRALASVPDDDIIIYKVKSGDTLSGIARRFRVSVNKIRHLNEWSGKYILRVGSKIKVPASVASEVKLNRKIAQELKQSKRQPASVKKTKKQTHHVIQEGESLASIARSYRVGIKDIIAVNNISHRSKILVGSKLLIPSRSTIR